MMTSRKLFNEIIKAAGGNELYGRYELEYASACFREEKVSDPHGGFNFELYYGGNEGVAITVSIYDSRQSKIIRLGTLKSLNTSPENTVEMGKLAGKLLVVATDYVKGLKNENR